MLSVSVFTNILKPFLSLSPSFLLCVFFHVVLSLSEGEGDIKLDRKKSFFGRHMGGMDRKSRMRGTLVQVKPGDTHLNVPTQNDKPGTSNEWDGRGSTTPYDSTQIRQASSTGNLYEGILIINQMNCCSDISMG